LPAQPDPDPDPDLVPDLHPAPNLDPDSRLDPHPAGPGAPGSRAASPAGMIVRQRRVDDRPVRKAPARRVLQGLPPAALAASAAREMRSRYDPAQGGSRAQRAWRADRARQGNP